MTVLSRVLALAVAVGLVVGALALRADRDEPVAEGGPGQDTSSTTLACPAELAATCTAAVEGSGVSVSVAPASDLAARLVTDDGEVALLPAAWVDVVDDDRTRRGTPRLARSDVLVSTPLLLVAFADRAEVLGTACGVAPVALDWSCVGEHVGDRWEALGGDPRWGDVRVGHLPPSTATGLQATAGVVAARTGLPFSLTDLRDVDVASWFRRVERAVPSFRPPGGSFLTAMVTRGPSAANVATVTEAELAGRDLTTTFGDLVVAEPDPLLAVELVVAGADVDAVRDVARRVDRSAWADAGWRTDLAVPPAGAPLPALPVPDETPSGGVLTALRTAWGDAVG